LGELGDGDIALSEFCRHQQGDIDCRIQPNGYDPVPPDARKEAVSVQRCTVNDPTGTPLNVRATPNGKIVGTLTNGTVLTVTDSFPSNGKTWAYVTTYDDHRPVGWVFRDFLDCNQAQEGSTNEADHDDVTYTYLCQDHHKAYPVTINTGKHDDCEGDNTSCTITWHGTTFRNAATNNTGCKEEWTATDNGVTIDVCAQTQGVARLKIDNTTFVCKMQQ
jgi:hypothetical protein